jgi:hypothetical protein
LQSNSVKHELISPIVGTACSYNNGGLKFSAALNFNPTNQLTRRWLVSGKHGVRERIQDSGYTGMVLKYSDVE